MIVYDVEQGEEEWFRCRMGIPTASCFDMIVTPGGALSKQAEAYANHLIAEIILREPISMAPPTFYMERGKINEDDAVIMYELKYGVDTKKVGFITDDQGRYGASPDRLVGDDGLVEIKVPNEKNHIANVLSGVIDRQYYPQVQGQMLVTGRKWVDWFSYHPKLPPALIRTERDEAYIAKLEEALHGFRDLMGEKLLRLKDMGYYDVTKPVQVAA